MLGNSKKKKTEKIDSLIGENTEITGYVKFTDGLHIDGTVKGNVIADADNNSRLSISEHGRIEGEIHVPYNKIGGTVVGNLYSSEHIKLESRARISGDVYYNLLEISSGAQVSGQLVYTPAGADEAPEPEEPATGEPSASATHYLSGED